jgi:uncharacterized cupin superfamily protein
MSTIKVEKNPDASRLDALGVKKWPTWSKEVSEFPWTYDGEETCYFLEGEVTVTPDGGEPVSMGQGDLATFPNGMSCRWHITKPVRKHFKID